MLKEFKKFVLRGNVVDLSVAVVIGAAFTAIVTALTNDFIHPLINAVYNQQKFSQGFFMFHGQAFKYGDFINAILSFLIVAFVVFFFVVQPINRIIAMAKADDKTAEPTTKKCPECFSEINLKATRCAFCTAKLRS